ncbi:ROK family transcriptional regulator [Micromonospora sp. ATCC 39149]|uniref:ROK family transcriptional regulator n=1 Tax=Micromonospora carbonacea TaxID=47853 RepID=A0A7D6CG11_9ACTN|nr:ROK family transcriptional regulator [Micromonospora sp. ATCC 39149]QLK00532.1 ROK family transcriptional regulator [Micromonospora carbonacea]
MLSEAHLTEGMRSVFVELLVHGPLSRAEAARRLDLSPSAVTKLTKPLLQDGYLLQQPVGDRNAMGRPSQPLAVDPARAALIGVKLTEDELFAVRTDLRAEIQRELRRPLISHDVDDVVACVGEAVRDLTGSGKPPAAVGISLAGTASGGDPVVPTSPFLGWRNVPLGGLVAAATGIPAVVVENDVRALTAAQQWFGAGVGHSSFALVTVGAGLGCGLVIGDRLVRGAGRGTGLVGHMSIHDSGPLCEMGHRGCARAYVSSAAIRRAVATTLDRPDLTFEACLALAAEGQPAARRILEEAGEALGQVVATVANITGVQLVILSGEAVAMYDVCAGAFDAALAAHTHWTSTPIDVVVKPFTFSEWARGAAVIALQHRILGR